MKKRILAAVLVTVAAGLFASFATTASAYPTKTTKCSSCHSGTAPAISATLASTSGTNATYNVSASGAGYIAVFNGTTKVTQITGASGTVVVPLGSSYTLYAVTGPTTSDGLSTLTLSPAAPVADTTAPVTTSDAKASYVSSAVIKLSATDNVGVTATYYILDGGTQTAGTTINVATAGSHTIEFWSVDAAGNIESHKTASFTITVPDTTAPVTTSDAKASYVSSAVIKLSATDNVGVTATYFTLDGGAQTAGTTINVATAGSHTIQFWSVDAAGNIEAKKSASFTITVPDTTAPVTTSDAKASYVSSAVIKLSATDAVGVTATYYILDGGTQVSGTTINVSTIGSHTIEFWSVDAAGNVESHKTASFVITAPVPVDTTAPVTSSDAKASYVSSAVIKLTATDNFAVTGTYYRLDGGAQVSGTTITVTAIGSHTIEFWSTDAAGNAETHKTASFVITAPVPVDTTAPVTSSDVKASYVGSAVIKLTATDAVGVAHTYYVVDGGAQVEGTTISLTAIGSHTIEFWSTDAAGNIESHKTASFAITAPPVLDTQAPVTTSDAKASYVSSAVIKLTATDNTGVTATYYKLDGGAQLSGTTINVTAIGSHTIEFWSVDAAGNIESHNTVTFVITAPVPAPDTTAPKTTSDAKASYVSSAVVKLSATDNVAVAHTYYMVDGAAQAEGTTISLSTLGTHAIEFWSVDVAGNVESHNTVTFSITAPAPAPTGSITIRSNDYTVRVGSTIRLSGLLLPANDDVNVSLYVKKPGSSTWVLVNRDETNDDGAWSLRYTPRSRGTYQFQARYGTLVSNIIKVSVSRSSD